MQHRTGPTGPTRRGWALRLLLALVVTTSACTTGPPPDQDAAPADAAADGGAAEDADAEDAEDAEDAVAAEDEAPQEQKKEAATGDGTATATLGDAQYQFRVINCYEDVTSPLVGDNLPFLLEGVPPDAPEDLVDPLRGLLTADQIEELDLEGMQALLDPVLDHGPVLSVTRVEDDGASDLMSLQFEDGTIFQTDFGGFLDISGSGAGATVTGSAEAAAVNIDDVEAESAAPGTLSVEANCS